MAPAFRQLPSFVATLVHRTTHIQAFALARSPRKTFVRNCTPDIMGEATSAPRRSTRVRKPLPTMQESSESPQPAPAKKARRSSTAKSAMQTKKHASKQKAKPEPSDIPRSDPTPDATLAEAKAEKGQLGPNSTVRKRKQTGTADPAKDEPPKKSVEDVVADEIGPPRPWGLSEDASVLKVVTWNVASCRSVVRYGALHPYIKQEEPDVLCLQETKMTPEAEEEFPEVPGYAVHWNHSERKKGYSGVALFIREDLSERKGGLKVKEVKKGMGVDEADQEGRVLSCYFDNGLVLINAYVPNSGGKLARLGFRTETFEPSMRDFLNRQAQEYRVLYCGDLNVAHMEIDIHNSKGNQKSAGHTLQERHEFSVLLESGAGWKDSFRELYPEAHGYTYYSRRFGPRMKNDGKGWRLDYHVVDSASFAKGMVGDVYLRPEVEGSDHYPLIIEYKL